MHCHGQPTTRPTATERAGAWVVVVPVKPLRAAKTRLRGAVPEAVHPDLVLAMARDTVTAALACREVARVLVICDDPAVVTQLTALGALCLPDAPAAGLNAALSHGAQAALQTFAEPAVVPHAAPSHSSRALPAPARTMTSALSATPSSTPPATSSATSAALSATTASLSATPPADGGVQVSGVPVVGGVAVVALTADLPALRPEDLEAALVAAARTGRRAFVPDLDGTGTVLLAAPAGQALAPQFGTGSAAAHLRSGAIRLDGAWPSLRRDVDTAADLDAAARLGVGTHTGQVICAVA